jgi:membrane protein
MKLRFAGLGTIFKRTFKGWNADDPFRQSAIIAYYAIFSLPALLVLIVNTAGLFFGKEAVSGEVSSQIESAMGEETAKQVSQMIVKAGDTKAGVISSIIAIVTIIFGATGVFIQLQKSLNQIWDVEQKPTKGFLRMLKARLFSFGLIVSIGFLLLMSLVISSVLAAMSHWLEARFPEAIVYLFYVVEFTMSLLVISTLFALMFKVLPDVKIKWREVITGSVLTGFLFMLGKYGLSLYFGKADPASAYGAAGSVVLILLWSSYSSMIVFFGAEFTKQYAKYHGYSIKPTQDAEKIDEGKEGLKREHQQAKKEEAEDTKENDHKISHYKKTGKMKSRKEIKQRIEYLEAKLENDKEGIQDNLKVGAILMGFLPKALRPKKDVPARSIDDYLKHMARTHITLKRPRTLMDRIKDLLNI